MAEITTGLRGLLRYPLVYETVQSIWGGDRQRKRFIDVHVRPEPGNVILDIGCGPAQLVRALPDVVYFGFEPNPAYVERARRDFGHRATFQCGFFDEAAAANLPPVDIAIVSAVLHHLDDAKAIGLFRLLRRVVKPQGRVVSLDNVFIEGQNPVARYLISLDRGRNVRRPEAYEALARTSFSSISSVIEHKSMPPYTYFIMTAS